MSKPKKKIGLVATEIEFKKHSIVYKVRFANVLNLKEIFEGVVISHNSIKDKDLILKTTYLDQNNFEVIFVPINVTVEFYQKIFHDKKSKLAQEYRLERYDIYDVGEIVGYVLL